MKKTMIFLSLLVMTASRGSTLFMPDSDTTALIALISNTASTVTNTLEILEVAKKTSQRIEHYNLIAMRRFFMARRIEQHARDMMATKKIRPRGLKEFNATMLRLKLNLKGLKSGLDLIASDLFEVENFSNRYWAKMTASMEDEQEAHNQELSSASEGSISKHVQNTAMNTALNGKILSKIRQDNLEYQKVDLSLKRAVTMERLRKEEFYRRWVGIPHSSDPLGRVGGQR